MFFIRTWNARLEYIQIRTFLIALAKARCKFDVLFDVFHIHVEKSRVLSRLFDDFFLQVSLCGRTTSAC